MMSSLQGQQQQQQQPDTQPFSSPSTAASPRTLTGQSRAASPTQRLGGYVKFFNSSKGYGFIIPTTERYEVFVHHTAIISAGGFRSLCEGEYVEFDVMQASRPNSNCQLFQNSRDQKVCRRQTFQDTKERLCRATRKPGPDGSINRVEVWECRSSSTSQTAFCLARAMSPHSLSSLRHLDILSTTGPTRAAEPFLPTTHR